MEIIAVVGRSQSGKTTLIRRLVSELIRRGRSVAVIKHCGSGFDLGGADKDSTLFLRAGAKAVTVTGPNGTAIIRAARGRPQDRDLAASHAEADFVFIEGGRTDPGIPAIEVIGPDPADRVPLRARDRLLIVSRHPLRSVQPVFSPERVEDIAELLLSRRAGDASESFFRCHDPAVRAILRKSVVGIAGAGGLGSNVALALARVGVGTLIIADFDRIELTNLNRQQYFSDQVGRVKVEALAENLGRIPSGTKVIARRVRVTAKNVARLFGRADVLVEAFDRADQKQMLIEAWMARFPGRPVIAASGLAGYGRNKSIRERTVGSLTLIGDEAGESPAGISPMAPRVGVVAAMQANRVMECLLKLRRTSC